MPRPLRDQVRWVVDRWQPSRNALKWILALTVVNAAVVVLAPIILARIIDGIGGDLTRGFILQNVLILLGLGVVKASTYYALQLLRMTVNIELEFGIRMRAFQTLLAMGPSFFTRFRTGDIVTRLTDEITERLSWYLCSGLLRTVEATILIVFGLLMMIRIDPLLTLAAVGPLPILIGIYFFVSHALQRRYRDVQEAVSAINDVLESTVSGIRVVKGFAVEPMSLRLADAAIERQRRAEVRAVRYQTVIDALYGHIWQLGIVMVLLVGGGLVIRGGLTLGELVAFDAYVLLLVFPMFDLGQFLVQGRLSTVSIDRILDLETVPGENGRIPESRSWHTRDPDVRDHAPQPVSGELPVTMEDVSYRHAGAATPALAGVTFVARPGELTAVAGGIGGGKTTLLGLIPGLLAPTGGRIRIGDRPLEEWDEVALRQRIGFVPQDPVLFSDTVRENVRFGRAWVSDEDVAWAVQVAGLEPDLATWARGMSTPVGTHGIRLSGGQKQRVALARALAGRPSVLLLDDCTASLDAGTEDRVWAAVFRELPGCTTIAVTHRPATLERAHRILVLESGELVETGTFRELNREGTRFHDLYVRWSLEDRTAE